MIELDTKKLIPFLVWLLSSFNRNFSCECVGGGLWVAGSNGNKTNSASIVEVELNWLWIDLRLSLTTTTTNPTKIYQKEVYYRLVIWHLDLTHKTKTRWSAMDGQLQSPGWSPTIGWPPTMQNLPTKCKQHCFFFKYLSLKISLINCSVLKTDLWMSVFK